MKSYVDAVDEIFVILNAAWKDPSSGANAIIKRVSGQEWGYVPVLTQPGMEVRPNSSEIYANAAYQTVVEASVVSAQGKQQWQSSGMLGIHIRRPRNDEVSLRICRLLAVQVQEALRRKSATWIEFSNQKIVEVGWLKGAYQINVFVTCKFITETLA